MKVILEDEGFDVDLAANGKEAIKKRRSNRTT
jgi:hypothetical protein